MQKSGRSFTCGKSRDICLITALAPYGRVRAWVTLWQQSYRCGIAGGGRWSRRSRYGTRYHSSAVDAEWWEVTISGNTETWLVCAESHEVAFSDGKLLVQTSPAPSLQPIPFGAAVACLWRQMVAGFVGGRTGLTILITNLFFAHSASLNWPKEK